jgi:phage-related protein
LNEAIASAFVRVTPDTRDFPRELDKGIAGPLDAMSNRLSSTFKKIGGALVAGFAAAKGFEWIKGAISSASDLNETISKTGEVFKESAAEILEWSKASAGAFGQSRKQALDAASTFAVFGKAAGLTGKDLVEFSTKLTGLASDLASFYNTSPEDAIVAIGAALRGEALPMRRYGVLLDDATLKQKAFQLGLIKTTKTALTPQAKVLAAQALIFDQTKDAQGDFARTSNQLANTQRILTARLEDVKAAIGQGLLPVVLTLAEAFAKMLPVLQRAGEMLVDRLAPIFQGVAKGVRGFVDALVGGKKTVISSGFIGFMERLGLTVRKVFDFLVDHKDEIKGAIITIGAAITVYLIPPLARATVHMLSFLAPAGLLVATLAAVGAGFVTLYKRSQTVRDALEPLTRVFGKLQSVGRDVAKAFNEGGFGAAFKQLGESLGEAWPDIKAALGDLADQVGAAITDVVWPAIKRNAPVLAKALWEWIKDVTPPTLRKLGEWAQALGEWIVGIGLPWLGRKAADLAKALWEWVKDAVPAALRQLGEWLASLGEWIAGTGLPTLAKKAAQLASGLLDWIGNAARDVLPRLGKWLGEVDGWLVTTAIPTIAKTSAKLVNSVLNWIGDAAIAAPGKMLDFMNAITNWVNGEGGRLLANAFKALGDVIIGVWEGIYNAIAALWNSTIGAISFKAPDWVPVLGGKGFDFPDMPYVGLGGGGSTSSGGGWLAPLSRAVSRANSTRPNPTGTVVARAMGGPVVPGRDYIVGERGPELFRTNTPGTIIPTNRLAGALHANSGVNVFNMTFNEKVDPMSVSAEIAWVLGR